VTGEHDASRDIAWRPAPEEPEAAETLVGYADLTEIGRGGDSIVYRARQVDLGRDVAVKVLLVDDESRAARFAREVEITLELGRQHPNIVNVLAVGTTDSGRPVLVMDYYAGGTLHDRLRAHGPLPVDEVVRIGVVLADALAFAHERGVLHRDVKPQNVLVLPTSWVLADFGIARLSDAEHTTSAETFTYRHAAPQILDGYQPTASDDLWSLGSTLFTMVDGRPPFASDDPHDDSALAYLRRARTEPHRRLTAPGVGPLAAVIDRCLAKDVDQRWSSAADLRDALADLRTSAWEPGSPEQTEDAAPTRPRQRDTVDDSADAAWAPGPAVAAAVLPATEQMEEQPDEVRPVEAPVALSAIAQQPAAVETDTEPTGALQSEDPDVEPPSAPGPSEAGGPPARSRTRRTTWVLVGTAIVVGLALGLGGALLRDDDRSDADTSAATPSPQGVPVPTLGAPPTTTDDPQPQGRPDPELRVLITELSLGLSTLDITWTDPSDGEGTFVLLEVDDANQTPLLVEIPKGTTSQTLSVATIPGKRVCFQILVFVSSRNGASQVRCTTA
jgi:serine/threonine protein kinase